MVPVMIFKLKNGTLSAFYHTNIELSNLHAQEWMHMFVTLCTRILIIIIVIIIIIIIIIVIIIKMFNRHILALKMNYNLFTKFRKSQKIILGLGL